jgi:hypothetical protein
MIPQSKNFFENNFPTFDNLQFSLPKKKNEDLPLNEQKQLNLKLQMLEERLKNSESKRLQLESINKNYMLEDKKKELEKMKEENQEKDAYAQMNFEAINVLKDIKEEINKKLGKIL